MAHVSIDAVREFSTTTGTGDITQAGAVAGHTAFGSAGIAVNDTFYYRLENRDNTSEWEVGLGTRTVTATIARTSVIRSSNSNALVSFSGGIKHIALVAAAEICNPISPGIQEGRLSLSSTLAVPTTDLLNKTSVYLLPHVGDRISLYNNSRWQLYQIPAAGVSVAVPATVFRVFDVYAYVSAGAAALECVNWNQTTGTITTPGASNASPIVVTSTSHGLSVDDLVGINGCVGNTAPNGVIWHVTAVTANTFTLASSTGNGVWTSGGTWYKVPNTRATALDTSTFPGVPCKTGDTSRKYLGTHMTTEVSGECEDSAARRYCWNLYNPVLRNLAAVDTTNTWTYTTAAWRQARGSNTNRLECVIGFGRDAVLVQAVGRALNSTADRAASCGVGVNSTTANSAPLVAGLAGNNQAHECHGQYKGQPGVGYFQFDWLEFSNSGVGTTTWYGDNGLTYWQSGIEGSMMG